MFNNKLKIKNLNENNKNINIKNVRYKKLFNLRNFCRNKIETINNLKFDKRDINK